jgi:NTP pyrophosphatase (non-canonical NTP hydrolase)
MKTSIRVTAAEIVHWATKTFPTASNHSRVQHIKKEVEELEAEPQDPNEMADILILLIHHAAANGVDIFTAVEDKFKILKTRKWGAPDKDGVVEHIE